MPRLTAFLLTVAISLAAPKLPGATLSPPLADTPDAPFSTTNPLAPAAALTPEQRRWVEETLAAMSLAEKAGQLVVPQVTGLPESPRAKSWPQALEWVEDLGVGGVVLSTSEVATAPLLLQRLQEVARVPLLVAADAERGMAFRVARGATQLPFAMAVGASRSPAAARLTGEIAAREARALGVHWLLAPVADLHSDPRNRVTYLRAFGENPEQVAELVEAFIEGAQTRGALATAKHFPGHGDTDIDSHLGLPFLAASLARLEEVELVPFRRAVEAGVAAVMTGHLAVPALDPSGAAATLSPVLTWELLRQRLGFEGLIVTDALDMAALGPVWDGEAAVRALQAGADVLLMPTDPRVAVQSVVRAVAEGQLSVLRLDASVRRLLEAKARVGLAETEPPSPGATAVAGGVARPEDVETARQIAAATLTLVRNEGAVLPLRPEAHLRLLHLVLAGRVGDPAVRGITEEELASRRIPAETETFGPEVSEATIARVLATAEGATHVLVSSFVALGAAGGGADLSPSQEELLRRLSATRIPLILVAFGSPYLLGQAPEVPVYLSAFGPAEASQRAVVAALFGETAIAGKLPLTLPGVAALGQGLEIARRPLLLLPTPPQAAGFRPGGLEEVERILDRFVAQGAFPGGVLAVGHRGQLAHLYPFGRTSWAEDAPAVAADTLYDLASLTKVVATTTMAMVLIDQGSLALDTRVQAVIPGFRGPGKEAVTVGHLLTHSSGLDWWAPLYQELRGPEAYLERIQASELVYPPGSRSLYSDLGVILLGEVLERVAGEPLEGFVHRRIFEPLGMDATLFRPPPGLRPRIAPTEEDPERGLVHGEVHDENAFALGGVAPHAGLFGTAGDLARFAQMVLWGGVYDHRRIASRATVVEFTTAAGVPGSTRALGWDTKSPQGSSAGELLSPSSFGHTGFTGTSLWFDPERELFVILLTNRVHPTRENTLIREARPAVADAVVRALADPGTSRP